MDEGIKIMVNKEKMREEDTIGSIDNGSVCIEENDKYNKIQATARTRELHSG